MNIKNIKSYVDKPEGIMNREENFEQVIKDYLKGFNLTSGEIIILNKSEICFKAKDNDLKEDVFVRIYLNAKAKDRAL